VFLLARDAAFMTRMRISRKELRARRTGM